MSVFKNLRRQAFVFLMVLFVLAALGCRQDMNDQPKYKPLRPSQLFADGNSSRPLVPGSVLRGERWNERPFNTGRAGNFLLDTMPVPLTRELLTRGQGRYDIYCTPCHDYLGSGRGMVVQRGFKQPPSYHIDRLRNAPDGHFFDIMTNGFGTMYSYSSRVAPADRWAIVAYIRVLQLSQNARLADVPPAERRKLEEEKP